MVIVGGGYIANEFAGIFHQLGSHVTIVNRSSTLLRGYDEQIRDRLLQISTMKGIQFRFNAEMDRIEKNDDGTLCMHFSNGDPIPCDTVMFATDASRMSRAWALKMQAWSWTTRARSRSMIIAARVARASMRSATLRTGCN